MNHGLNLRDSAVVYGMGASENVLAAFAKQYPHEDVMISTKFTPQIAGESANPVEDMCNGSLERFGTDYIDVYWIYNPADVEKWTPFLAPLVKSGKVRRIGVSNYNPKLVKITGLSRGFFYKNPTIRSEIDRAIEQQAGTVDPRRGILDKAMNDRIELLQQQLAKLKRENEALKKENERLQKALNKKSLNILRGL